MMKSIFEFEKLTITPYIFLEYRQTKEAERIENIAKEALNTSQEALRITQEALNKPDNTAEEISKLGAE